MKKMIADLLMTVILASTACAEVDLAAMTFEELLKLRNDVLAEISTRPEFESFTVPAGEWTVGEDFPAGAYKLELTTRGVTIHVWGAAYKDYTTNGGLIVSDYRETGYGKLVLRPGNILIIDKPVKLSIYSGL